MKKLYIILAVALTAALSAGSALAQNCNGNGSCSHDTNIGTQNNNTSNQGGTGYGGTGYGGKAENNVGNGFGNFSPSADAEARASAEARVYNTNGQQQGQHQGQGQGQGQLQGQGQVNGNADNSQSLKLQQYYSADPGRNNTPSIGLGGLYPSAPCMGTSNIGGSGPGFSVGFGTSWTDKNCQIMETSRLAPTDADKVAVWCLSEFAANAPSCKAAAKKTEAEAAKVAEQSEKRKVSDQREAANARPTESTVAKNTDPYADYFSR